MDRVSSVVTAGVNEQGFGFLVHPTEMNVAVFLHINRRQDGVPDTDYPREGDILSYELKRESRGWYADAWAYEEKINRGAPPPLTIHTVSNFKAPQFGLSKKKKRPRGRRE